MISTEALNDFLIHPSKVFKEEYLKEWERLTGDKDCSELMSYLSGKDYYNVFCFDTGWLIFEINKEICHIWALYKNEKGKVKREELISIFIEFIKANKCNKITMQTKLDPHFWERDYGFEHKAHLMELKI